MIGWNELAVGEIGDSRRCDEEEAAGMSGVGEVAGIIVFEEDERASNA